MATFNVSFLNPQLQKKSSGAGVGVLADQLTILENTLAKDGFLSPGDYEKLIEEARKIQLSGALTQDQISNYDVKISNYEKQKELSNIDKTDDITRMNNILNNESNEDVIAAGNNPRLFLQGKIASLEAKLNDLASVIDRREVNGQDTAEYYNEYSATLQDYKNRIEIFERISEGVAENRAEPINGYVAYVETNNNGEIVNVDYNKYGSKTGYVETNGMIDGIQVYGKVNYKREGENYFILGGKTFSASNLLTPDPLNPGQYTTNKLMANVDVRGWMRKAEQGYVNLNQADLEVQGYIPKNSWAKGVNGTLYQKREDGGYTKYLNATEEDLDINGPITNLPQSYEQGIMSKVDDTVDFTQQILQDQNSINMATGSLNPGTNMQDKMQVENPLKTSNYDLQTPFDKNKQSSKKNAQLFRTPQQPSQQVDKGILPTAKRTIQSGIESFRNLFK